MSLVSERDDGTRVRVILLLFSKYWKVQRRVCPEINIMGGEAFYDVDNNMLLS